MHLLVEHGMHMMQNYLVEGMSKMNTGEFVPDDGKPGWLLACFVGPGLTVQGNTDKCILARQKSGFILGRTQNMPCLIEPCIDD